LTARDEPAAAPPRPGRPRRPPARGAHARRRPTRDSDRDPSRRAQARARTDRDGRVRRPPPRRHARTTRPRRSPRSRVASRPRPHARRAQPRAGPRDAADGPAADRARTSTHPPPRPVPRALTAPPHHVAECTIYLDSRGDTYASLDALLMYGVRMSR